ncbi:protein FAM169B-like isoform X2 [Athalia rosae]|uniref:protein FAM169B-like isoform X2 n=1 Tax=Athalia rosae TaxID=37344 RepID=UPI000624F52B|nr:protein FAM169B-like isoform X2 [Athalia rosae]
MHNLHGRFKTDSMLCSSCFADRPTKSLELDLSKYRIQGDFKRLDCRVCGNFVAIQSGEDIIKVDGEIDIHFQQRKNLSAGKEDSWCEAKTEKERIVYYALSQIVYPERDAPNGDKFESMYDFADESDLVMLRWKSGIPIGFYTLKRKGSLISMTNEEYSMPTLDTAYIRSEYRRRGIGIEILENITQMFPEEEIGLSRPISDAMWKVLEKFLTTNKAVRLKFWEIEDGGNEGNRKLIWFMLKKRKSNSSFE